MDNWKNPIEVLSEEHHSVLGKLQALEEAINNLDQRERISTTLKELTAFFKTEFWTHFDKEEKALFPEFDNFMPRGAGPLAVMIEEHEVIRDTNEVIQEAVARYFAGDDNAEVRQTILQSGTHFIGFLREHITKEEGLFPRLAEMHLGPAQIEKVGWRFVRIEAKELG